MMSGKPLMGSSRPAAPSLTGCSATIVRLAGCFGRQEGRTPFGQTRTRSPSSPQRSSSIRFAFWFAMAATVCAVGLTTALTVAEHRAARPSVPRAKAKYTYN